MKNLCLLFISLFVFVNIYSQEIKRNNIFLELGGAGVIGSVNYERMLTDNTELNFPLRIGALYLYDGGMPKSHTLVIPMSISVMKKFNGSKNMFWELKAIASVFYQKEIYGETWRNEPSIYKTSKLMPGVSVGLRRHDFSGGFYYHFHLQLIFNNEEFIEVPKPWFSIGLGHVL